MIKPSLLAREQIVSRQQCTNELQGQPITLQLLSSFWEISYQQASFGCIQRTRAFAYVPSSPNTATGGLVLSGAAAAYVRRKVRGAPRLATAKAGRASLEAIVSMELKILLRG